MSKLVCTATISALLLLAAQLCKAQDEQGAITGSITYRERLALPSDAAIEVQLVDTSVADIAAQTIAQSMFNAEGRQVPIPFTLNYDPARIAPEHRYSVRATIRSADGMLLFSTTQAYPVLTHSGPAKVNLLLHTVGHGAKPGVAGKRQAGSTPEAEKSTAAAINATSPPSEPAAASVMPVPEEREKAPAHAKAPAPIPSTSLEGDTLGITEQRVVVETEPARETKSTISEIPGPAEFTSSDTTPPASESDAVREAASSSTAGATRSALQNETAMGHAATAVPPTTEPAPAQAQDEAAAGPATSAPQPEIAPVPPTAQTQPVKTEIEVAATEGIEGGPSSSEPVAKTSGTEAPLPDSPSASKAASPASMSESANTATGSDESERQPARSQSDKPLSPLADTQWRLVELNGLEIVTTPPNRPLTLAFSPEGARIAGSTGCNSYRGTFSDYAGLLHLNPVAMPMLGCDEAGAEREQNFVAVLRLADGYKIEDDILLLTSRGKIVAKFRNIGS